ncbi:MAG: glycosyltransferase [Sphingobacteriaceae bacterium]|nr:glycosyltransferase [Sphingobacteriaceae bacterium]
MKVLLLSDSHSEHTEKWALGLAARGIKIGIFSFNKSSYQWFNNVENITLLHETDNTVNAKRNRTKFKYIQYVSDLKKAIREFQPDILHAHYATSYGLIGALSGFHPYIISVWGEDVYKFPNASGLHKSLLKYNLRKADEILSTSDIMRNETRKYTHKDIMVTPFGVDTNVFCKKEVKKDKDTIYIGTIKAIEDKYGIKYIIEAAKILKQRITNKKLKVLLIGPGTKIDYYKSVVKAEGLEGIVELTGRINFNEVSDYHNLLDVFLNVSVDDSESFGVAVVEAMACETPVVVSNVGGLKEVVDHGEYGIVVKKESAEEIANAVEKIINDQNYVKTITAKAREHVLRKYDFNVCLDKMIHIYKTHID